MPILTNSDYSREIRFTARQTKQPVDLTGCALEMVIKAKRGDAVGLLTLTIGAGLSVPNPPDGKAIMALTAAQTSEIGAGERVWAIHRCDGGRRLCLATGKMIVRDGI